MLSIFRGVLRQRTLSQLRQASFAVRDLLHERSDETGTLLNRFSRHVAIEGGRVAPLIPHTIRYADYFPVVEMHYFNKQLARTAADQIPTLLMYAFTYRPSADPAKFVQVLNTIDNVAVRLLPDMDTATILRTLYAWLYLMPNWIMRIDFYHAALEQLSLTADSEKEHFMQVCFYLGLSRKPAIAEKLSTVLAEHLERHLPNLSTMDLAIIANAAFKTSTEVKSAAFNAKLEEEILSLTLSNEHIALLITLLKSIRLQRVCSRKVCEHLSQLCSAEGALRQLEPRALSHILAFYAENLWDDESTKQLTGAFLRLLNKSPMEAQHTEIIRPKDMATFLWATAHLNLTFSTEQLQDIEAALLGMVHQHEFEHFPDQLVDSCLSLWMLGLQSQELLHATVLAKREFGTNRAKPKVESRLTVLLAAAAIQQPKWKTEKSSASAFKLKAEVPAYIRKMRPDVVKCAQQLTELDGIAAANVTTPINGINIPGIHVQCEDTTDENTKSEIFVELLSDRQTLEYSKKPVGLVGLKLALLKSRGYKTLVYPSRDATEDIAKLHDTILNSIKGDEPVEEQTQSIQSI